MQKDKPPVKTITLEGDAMETNCCDTGVQLVKVGHEIIARCAECHEYIGNVATREITLVEAHYEQFMSQVLADRKETVLPSPQAIKEMFPTYAGWVLEFAMQAARKTIGDYYDAQKA